MTLALRFAYISFENVDSGSGVEQWGEWGENVTQVWAATSRKHLYTGGGGKLKF